MKNNKPIDATHYHRRIGYLKDVFGRHVKPKVWIDGAWRNINLFSSLETKEFKNIKEVS